VLPVPENLFNYPLSPFFLPPGARKIEENHKSIKILGEN
jgi:hypothetical protein